MFKKYKGYDRGYDNLTHSHIVKVHILKKHGAHVKVAVDFC